MHQLQPLEFCQTGRHTLILRPAAAPAGGKAAPQILTVKLFSPAEDSYSLGVKMERFLKESQVDLPLTPAVTTPLIPSAKLLLTNNCPSFTIVGPL